MRKITPKFATAPAGDFNSFSGGQKFEIENFDEEENSFETTSPISGTKLYCLAIECAHLDGKNWILSNK